MEINGKEVKLFIELREVYDGWSIAVLEDGTAHNRWPEGDKRHDATARHMLAHPEELVL